MTRVQFGKVWTINNMADYQNAMEVLEGNLFIANMTDDYNCYYNEFNEISKQIYDVREQATTKHLI